MARQKPGNGDPTSCGREKEKERRREGEAGPFVNVET